MTIPTNNLREIPIISVAERLNMNLYGIGELNRRCICPFHDDHSPSMHLNARKNIFKCFSCGKGGDAITLVMQVENKTYQEACQWLVNEFGISVAGESRNTALRWRKSASRNILMPDNDAPLSPSDIIPEDILRRTRSISSLFCQSLLKCSYLSYKQLCHAAQQYRLGASHDGGVVFWQIDEQQRIRTGKVMYYQPDCHRIKSRSPTWVHSLLKHQLSKDYTLHRCLFGQHLLSGTDPGTTVCVVESEKTAVICSEHFPQCLWLACGGLHMFSPGMLAPLTGHKVVIFPDTDLTGDTYRRWADIVRQASRMYRFRYPVRVSRLLEDKASQDQKTRKIDITDFLFEVKNTDE